MEEDSIAHLSEQHQQLWRAVQRGQVAEVRRLLPGVTRQQLDSELRDGGRTTLLHLVCSGAVRDTDAALAICQLLLDAGAPVDAYASSHETPLLVAGLFGRAAIVKLLLQHGANPYLADADGKAPLELAEAGMEMGPLLALAPGSNHKEFIRLLRQACSETQPLSRQAKQAEGCGHCARADVPLKKCARCTLKWYCSTNCQRADYGAHKARCVAAGELREQLQKAADPGQPALQRLLIVSTLADVANAGLRQLAVQLKGVKLMLAALPNDRPAELPLPGALSTRIVTALALCKMLFHHEVLTDVISPAGAPITTDVLMREGLDQFAAAHGHEVVLRRVLEADCPGEDRKELLRLLATMHAMPNDKYGVDMVLSRQAGLPVVDLLCRLVRQHPQDLTVVSNTVPILGTLCLGELERSGSAGAGSSSGGGGGSSSDACGPLMSAVLAEKGVLMQLANLVFDHSVPGGALRQAPLEFYVCLAHSPHFWRQLLRDEELDTLLLGSALVPLAFAGTPTQAAALEWFSLALCHKPGYLGDFDHLLDVGCEVLGQAGFDRVSSNVLDALLQAVQSRGRPPTNNSFIVNGQPLKAALLLRRFVCELDWPESQDWVHECASDIRSTGRRVQGEAAQCLRAVLTHCGCAAW